MIKEEVLRGTRKRFQTTLTDLGGSPQDPDTCEVRLEKVGVYGYDSPTEWYTCTIEGGNTGIVYADIWLPNDLTLGDWLARFKWTVSGVDNYDAFYFTIIRRDKPWVNTQGPVL